jgi:CDP-glycerol glycerophosphotransferase
LTPRQRDLHRERRLGVTVDEFPEILADVFPWNKVFRRSFWEGAQMSFPDRVRYEDQVALTRAFLVAERFDVVRAPVYLWRLRDDSSSITQRRHELGDLQDRMSTKRASLDIARALGSPAVLRRFYNDALSMDLPSYFWEIPGCDETYWRLLSSGLKDLWAAGPPFTESTLPVQHRLVAWLVVAGRRSEAETVLSFVQAHRPDLPVDERDGHQVALLPYCDDPDSGIPAELYRLTEHDAGLIRRARAG